MSRLPVTALRALWLALAACCLALAVPSAAWAHKASDAYLAMEWNDDRAQGQGRWDIALRDLEAAVGLDGDGNGEITWGELRARHAAIAAYALARLELRGDGQACTVRAGAQQVENYGDGAYTVLPFEFSCPAAVRTLAIGYRLLADTDPLHRGLLRLQVGTTTRSAVLDPAAEPQRFDLTEGGHWSQFTQYLAQGVWHIWIGVDHILFLVALLLPAVLWREGRRWIAAPGFSFAFWDVLKIVTGFTVAHSITLTLATLGWVTLPSRPVEATIAASVALAAANNVVPLIRGRRWAVAFAFGLIHGFGFAGALAELGLPQGALALSLVGFNLGVELGQLAIVVGFLPLAHALRHTAFYRQAVLVGGSLAIAALALVWFAERAFGLSLLAT